jgi:hypothetical protein
MYGETEKTKSVERQKEKKGGEVRKRGRKKGRRREIGTGREGVGE